MRDDRRSIGAGMLCLAAILISGCNGEQKRSDGMVESSGSETVAIEDTAPAVMIEQQLAEAESARDAGNYDSAMALFREILSKNPTVATAYVGIGDIYMAKQDYANAEPNFSRAARLEPRNFDAQFGHGLALQMLSRFVEAIRAYNRALVIRPSSHEANLSIATTYLQMNEPRSALLFAQKAVEIRPDDGPSRLNLGAAYGQLGMYDEAIEQYLVAVELVDATPELRMNLVNAFANAGRYQETINAAETLNAIAPTANAYERMGWAWFRLKDYDKSQRAYRAAVDLDPTHWPSWNGIGINALNTWLLSQKRDSNAREEAGDALRQSLRINAEQPKIIQLMTNYRL